jgi:ribosomal protein L11 methyltransferase
MDYTEISVWAPTLYAESVAWHLAEWGCEQLVVSEISAKGPTPAEVAVKVYKLGTPETQADFVAELRTKLADLKAFFPDFSPRLETRLVPEENWANSWKQYWHPQEIGERLVIKPSWEAYDGPADKILIELDPKQAFGTGTHPTTQLCLRSLETILPGHESPLVFDVGTGSGILAVAAVKLGARHVEACDTDPVAVAATIENAELNGVAGEIMCHEGGIETIIGVADVLVVNILAEVVAALAGEIAERVRPGGDIIASGIIRERQSLVEQAFEAEGLSVLRVEYQGEWTVIEARKPESFVIERK